MKFYVAGAWTDRHGTVCDAQRALRDNGHDITHDWTQHGEGDTDGLELACMVAQGDLAGVYEADALLVVLPGARGTHVELGYALALGKPVVLVGDMEPGIGERGCCPFYALPNVVWFRGVPDALSYVAERWHAAPQPEPEPEPDGGESPYAERPYWTVEDERAAVVYWLRGYYDRIGGSGEPAGLADEIEQRLHLGRHR